MTEPSERPAGLQALADKHGFGVDAVRSMLQALEIGDGRMAQFDHPEFGGLGQWFSGGMVMVGRMNDHGLKARVSALCDDLAAALPADGWGSRSQSTASATSFVMGSRSGPWWPEGLGRPSSVGAQNATRYAYFPETRRLAVDRDGTLRLYDTGTHVITGVSQQQGGTHSLRFSSAQGTVSVDELTPVETADKPAETSAAEPMAPAAPPRQAPVVEAAPARPTPAEARFAHAESDILTTLERLAGLHDKGILTDEEFSNKKAELLARL